MSDRLDFIMSNLDNSEVNLITSRGNIEDADFCLGEYEIGKSKDIGTGCYSNDCSGKCKNAMDTKAFGKLKKNVT